MTKLIDRPSQPIPAAPRGLVYWSNRKISQGLTNTAHLSGADLRRGFGKDEQGTSSFLVNDGSVRAADQSSPFDVVVDDDHSIQPSQRRRVLNPDAIVDPEMPGTGSGTIAGYANHSTIGEDASFSASLSGAVTNEPLSPVRVAVDVILSAHPGMSYRAAAAQHRADVERAAARQAAKSARNRRRRQAR